MSKRHSRRPAAFRPCIEGLEDRCLLSGGLQVVHPQLVGTEEQFKQALLSQALEQYKDLFGKTFTYNIYPPGIDYRTTPVVGVFSSGAVTTVAQASASRTNV